MSADSHSSSSDFSSDDENENTIVEPSYASSLTPHVVQIEIVEDDEMDTVDAADGDTPELSADELLAPLRDGAVPEQLLQAMEPLLTAQSYSYDAYSTALYYTASLWPLDAPAATQRALHRARAAMYRRFYRAFPLTPEMYEEYISDVESARAKLRLYEQSMRDYWSVALSLQYLRLLSDSKDVVPGLSWSTLQARMAFALDTVGHHYTQGADVWTLCRELTAQHFDDQEPSHGLAKERALRTLFVRQMQLPLQHNDLAMSEFRAWNQYNTLQDKATRQRAIDDAEAFQQHTLAKNGVYKKLNQYEARLASGMASSSSARSAADHATQELDTPERVWMQYLQYVQSQVVGLVASKDAGRRYVVCAMERAVASVCLSATLWRKYILYAQSHSTSGWKPRDLEALCLRATRNVSFDSFAWVEWLLALEATQDCVVAEINATVENALLCRTHPPLLDSAHMTRVLVNYCALVRRVSGDTDATLDAAVERCQAFAEAAFPAQEASAMIVAALLHFQAQYYAFRSQSAKWWAIWQQILKLRGTEADAWLRLYEEFVFVHQSQSQSRSWATLARELRAKVFQPAVDTVRDYPLAVLDKWLQFELSAGDHDDYKRVQQAHDKLQQQLTRLQYQAQAADADTAAAIPAATAVVTQPVAVASAAKKRKAETSALQAVPAKRLTPHESKPKTQRFNNEHTLFVCNLSKATTTDALRAAFAHISTLKDVRLVAKERRSHVKSRGMAYVQFEDDAGVVAGLLVDGKELDGQKIKVERSLPPNEKTSTKAQAAAAPPAKATTTLYVGGLLPSGREPITEDQLLHALVEVLDARNNSVKQALILTDKRGRPKDYGLVEVAEPSLVEHAVGRQAELQRKLGDQVTVQPSRMTIDQVVRHRNEQKQASLAAKQAKQPPPPTAAATTHDRGRPHTKAPHTTPVPRLMVPTAATGLRPRALRKKTLTTTTPSTQALGDGPAPPTTASGDAPKTNADFRKLFLN